MFSYRRFRKINSKLKINWSTQLTHYYYYHYYYSTSELTISNNINSELIENKIWPTIYVTSQSKHPIILTTNSSDGISVSKITRSILNNIKNQNANEAENLFEMFLTHHEQRKLKNQNPNKFLTNIIIKMSIKYDQIKKIEKIIGLNIPLDIKIIDIIVNYYYQKMNSQGIKKIIFKIVNSNMRVDFVLGTSILFYFLRIDMSDLDVISFLEKQDNIFQSLIDDKV